MGKKVKRVRLSDNIEVPYIDALVDEMMEDPKIARLLEQLKEVGKQ